MTKESQSAANAIRAAMPRLARKYGVSSVSLFGSVVRGDHKRTSDLDVMVEFSDPPGLFRFLELEDELGEMTGMKVDLVEKKTLKPAIGRCALREAIAV